ncbi:hypothetical protein BMI86_13860 [Thioclava sp. DLFJ5-1]|nr:hypothetical protein BMI86_13860 [Thioclava sp. DLFJ5-1]
MSCCCTGLRDQFLRHSGRGRLGNNVDGEGGSRSLSSYRTHVRGRLEATRRVSACQTRQSVCARSCGTLLGDELSNGYTPAAVAEFLNKADYQLVAHALSGGHQIVTLDTSEPPRKNKIKIPDAGNAKGVSSISPYEMLRRNGVRL